MKEYLDDSQKEPMHKSRNELLDGTFKELLEGSLIILKDFMKHFTKELLQEPYGQIPEGIPERTLEESIAEQE